MSKAQCVRCFFLMQRSIEARKYSYLRQYGHYPRFKAGLHCGRVVATWVGKVKRKIVYHGDVLNTTARIQSLCNELGQELLISEDLLTQLPLSGGYSGKSGVCTTKSSSQWLGTSRPTSSAPLALRFTSQ